MTARSWIRKLFARPAARPAARPTRMAPARRPHLEALEDRLAPAAYHVTSLSDDGSTGTLRDAITQANANPGPDTIDFRVTGTISLNGSQLPAFTDPATTAITGPSGGVTLDAGGASRIFQVSAGDVTLSYLTLTNGRARGADGANAFFGVGGDGGDGEGGAIYVGGGAVTLNNSTLANNIAQGGNGGLGFPSGGAGGDGLGGAIYVGGGAVTLNNSTLANNIAQGGFNLVPFGGVNVFGGAVYVNFGASATLTNATVSGNSARTGGGLFSNGTATLTNTIVAGNTGGNIFGDYSGSHNLVDGDPLLAPLGDYGGPTQTMALLPGSPALDAGDSTAPGLPGTDQRGLPRDARPDIGAFEAQKPTLTLSLTAVTVNEGSPATNTGTFDDLLGRATVTLTASLGTITRDDSTGNWSWSYTPADGPSGPTTVTLTATNFSGLEATTTFTLAVNNVAPAASITGVPATGHSPEGTAITLGSTVTDPSPADTAAGFTYAWSVTRDGAAFASGISASFSFTPDDNGTYVVTLTATDKDGGVSPPASTTITVDNVAPTAGVSGPADGVRGQARTFTLTASDPSPVDQVAGLTFAIAWGDGTTQTVTGPSGTAVSHLYTASGAYNVQVTAKDRDGGTSAAATQAVTITAAALQADPTDPSKTALVVGGTTGADTIVIKPTDASGTVNVKIGATSLGNFQTTGHIIVYGQAGDDAIKLQTANIGGTVYVGAPAFLFGGDGKDTLDSSGSSANNVLQGGAGNDNLKAGSGRDLLIGGLGADVLQGTSGDDILIGSMTDYDANLAALNAVMAEWGRTDADYQTRVNHLNGTLGGGLNGGLLLTANTVHDDAASDQLSGGAGMDWFLALLSGTNKDVIKDWASEVVTGL